MSKNLLRLLKLLVSHGGQMPMSEIPHDDEELEKQLVLCLDDDDRLVDLWGVGGRAYIHLNTRGHARYERLLEAAERAPVGTEPPTAAARPKAEDPPPTPKKLLKG